VCCHDCESLCVFPHCLNVLLHLCRELWMDSETASEISRLQRALSMVRGYRDSVAHHARALDNQERALHSVLAPDQSVRLMSWLSKNRERLPSTD
jgi:hypothetical protein